MTNEWDPRKDAMILALVVLAFFSYLGIRNIVEMVQGPEETASVPSEMQSLPTRASSPARPTSRFDSVLEDLARTCQESEGQLRRMITRAVEIKSSEGVATDSLDIAEGLRRAVTGIRPGECVDELSGLMLMMDYQ